ncbi:YcaO-like family protein [Amycolatopsis sp. cmx-4-61]|uniref:YcaO-like family protein n=1 Tax=Amycolatopsis sp. cmx-4-61 TaxID=2790937 RepID=UPI00397AD607
MPSSPSHASSPNRNTATAAAGAVGESIERHCGNVIDHSVLTYARNDELRDRGYAAVDPDERALFSPTQHEHPGFPFLPFTPGTCRSSGSRVPRWSAGSGRWFRLRRSSSTGTRAAR